MIHNDELPLLTQNKSAADICLMYEDLDDKRLIFRESVRNFLSRFLMDTDEEHPYECDITLDYPDGFGLSSLDYPHLKMMWQEPSEGTIYFAISGYCDCGGFDSMRDDELMKIIEYINDNA